jgi:hypothetical protein
VHHKTKAGLDFTAPPEFPANLLPPDCARLLVDALQTLQSLDSHDDFGGFVLRHVSSWVKYGAKDPEFYPILWEA